MDIPTPPDLPVHEDAWFTDRYNKLKESEKMDYHQLIFELNLKANSYGGLGSAHFLRVKRLEVTKFLLLCAGE